MLVPVEEVRSLALRILSGNGIPRDFARTQTDLLIEAELRGFPSHGLLRLSRVIERIRNGVTNPTTIGKQEWRSPAFLHVDGQMGLGPVVAMAALKQICARAKELGVAFAAINNNNHIGMLAWYAEQVAADGQVALMWTTSEALVHPWGGTKALVGTNPIAIAIPAEPFPFVFDAATSIVPMGKIHDYAHRHQPIPGHWALDKEGRPTTDPVAAKDGAIAPFGEAKGYAFGLAFEILVACLTGSALAPDVHGTLDSDKPCNKGDVFIVLSPDLRPEVTERIKNYLTQIRACPTLPGFDAVMIPGDRERQSRKAMLSSGITVADEVWTRMVELASEPAAAVG